VTEDSKPKAEEDKEETVYISDEEPTDKDPKGKRIFT